ncbi:hypothetical protein YC2023_073430 [Brassica napus]
MECICARIQSFLFRYIVVSDEFGRPEISGLGIIITNERTPHDIQIFIDNSQIVSLFTELLSSNMEVNKSLVIKILIDSCQIVSVFIKLLSSNMDDKKSLVPISKNSLNGYKKLQAVLKAIMMHRTKENLLDGQPIINLLSCGVMTPLSYSINTIRSDT